MNISNTAYIQATIEIFGALICVIVTVMFWIMTENRRKSERHLTGLMAAMVVSFLMDAGCYLADGRITPLGFVANRFCNLALFLCTPVILFLGCCFICALIRENGGTPRRGLAPLAGLLILVMVLLTVFNMFSQWMYSISTQNVYSRENGWFLYTGLSAVVLFLLAVMVFHARRSIPLRQRVTIYLFLFSPFIGILLQAAKLGISFIQLGMGVALMSVLYSYVREWIGGKQEDQRISSEKKKFWLIESLLLIMILCISASIISSVFNVRAVSDENSRQNSLAIGHMVSETIEASLSGPVDVARAMADAEIIQDALSLPELEGTETERKMLEYMTRLKKEYNFQMVFLASDRTKAYYTYQGLSRYMDTENDPNDAWYQECLGQNRRYVLNVDTDKDNGMSLAVFVNMKIRDDKGKVIGVCGVGTSMESLMTILSRYEMEYGVDVSLVDTLGLVQVDTDRYRIETDVVERDVIARATSDDISYSRDKDQAILTKYMSDLGWYLVVEDNRPDKLKVMNLIMPSLIVYLVGILLMMLFLSLFRYHERRKNEEILEKKQLSETDSLTGLGNRLAYEIYRTGLDGKKLPEGLSLILLDVNGLKSVNDNIGHEAGDELIRGAADAAGKAFGEIGTVFRIGGDEFLVAVDCSREELQQAVSVFAEVTAGWKGSRVQELSVSAGAAQLRDHEKYSYRELFEEAERLMYEDKNRYYITTGKDRRRR